MDFKKDFPGTLFRFPLRTPAQATVSRISHKGHAPEEAAQLLRDFAQEAAAMLLFLKTVERVEVTVPHLLALLSATYPYSPPRSKVNVIVYASPA